MHSYARLYEDQKKKEKEWTITDAGNTQHFANHKNETWPLGKSTAKAQ